MFPGDRDHRTWRVLTFGCGGRGGGVVGVCSVIGRVSSEFAFFGQGTCCGGIASRTARRAYFAAARALTNTDDLRDALIVVCDGERAETARRAAFRGGFETAVWRGAGARAGLFAEYPRDCRMLFPLVVAFTRAPSRPSNSSPRRARLERTCPPAAQVLLRPGAWTQTGARPCEALTAAALRRGTDARAQVQVAFVPDRRNSPRTAKVRRSTRSARSPSITAITWRAG